MDFKEKVLKLHEENKGKIEVVSKVEVKDAYDLSLVYTPGVALVCKEIEKDPENSFKYTSRGNLVAVVTDGSAILGLGNIGSIAGAPVMEGKSTLFKILADVDAFPIMLETQDVDEIVNTIKQISPSFGGINLEDIAAPKCFEVARRLEEELDIPVFHDDQYGTAIIVLAAVTNSLKLTKKDKKNLRVVINGVGAAGVAICDLLLKDGFENIVLCDSRGIIYEGRENLNDTKKEFAKKTNKEGLKGDLSEALKGADIFIGVSQGNLLTKEMVHSMNEDPIVFAMANPTPEIMPDLAKEAGAKIVGTGRSDFPNQVNNVSVFPGIFRGVLDVRARIINDEMKLAAAKAIADYIPENELREDYVLPDAFDKNVAVAVANAVAKAAKETKVARV